MRPIVASDRRHHALSRRDFVAGLGKAAAVGIVAPFTFVRRAAARTDALRRFLVKKLAEANTPGIAVAVVRPDEVVWSAGVGWADKEHGIRVTRETAFQLASVSKTVTCAGIMALVQDGALDLIRISTSTFRSRYTSPRLRTFRSRCGCC